MTTKIQREAYCLTILASDLGLDFDKGDIHQKTIVLNIASESGIAAMSLERLGYDHYIFVPQAEVDKVRRIVELDERMGVENADYPMLSLVSDYYHAAMAHDFEL